MLLFLKQYELFSVLLYEMVFDLQFYTTEYFGKKYETDREVAVIRFDLILVLALWDKHGKFNYLELNL